MKTIRPGLFTMFIGILIGMGVMSSSGADAAGGGMVPAYPVQIKIMMDGQQANIQAYGIDGTTYVRLVDVGKEVGFNVYWDGVAGAVQVESSMPYTGKQTVAKDDAQFVEKVRTEIVAQTNAVRKKYGIKVFTADEKLMQAAQVRALELAATTTYAHTRPDGSKFSTVTDCPYVGENIHRIATRSVKNNGLELADAVMGDWLNSAGHRENILNQEVTSLGVGVAKGVNANGEEAWYCVQLFMVDGCTIHWVDSPIIP